ncbi:alpha/beta fold hydrolase [Oricola cellulosilytica]|uniref:Alpha/beta hydrolase n=1 Tax=Oricola cellulosilytica TaxID=1429082 RepID=A0A4R0P9G1_9HYPH|nr:alpha/beta hydrolase [Oricola cellulosilytica]TCD12308.1 alpha/beta hydrolase [Oricola cellulosilytica]
MRVSVNGHEAFAATGGKPHRDGLPWIIFLHGSGQSHITWTQQVRALGYDGFNTAAVDFPGHGLSNGAPLTSIGAMADWLIAFMDAAGIPEAHIVGHSQGCLVALELGARYPERVSSIAFIATGAAIPVNPGLVALAGKDEPRAIDAMLSWGFGAFAHHQDNSVPGSSLIFGGVRTMQGNVPGALETDLKACNAYDIGAQQAAKIACPTACILAGADRMTPLKAGLALAEALDKPTVTIIDNAGHMLPGEHPHEVNRALRAFHASFKTPA